MGLLVLGLVSLFVSGCDGDSKSSGTGPSSSGFSGSTVTVNPVIQFLDGSNVAYTNTDSPSDFPAAATAVNGTYSYTPSADAKTGTLVLTLPAPVGPLTLELKSFANSNGKVTGFTATFNGRNFPATVTSGSIAVASTANSGNSGGSVGANEEAATDIPATMQGTYSLVFFESASGSGIADGATTQFVIGAKTLAFSGKTLTNPVFRNGNDLEWIFKDGALEYAASIAVDNGLNEINVGGAGGAPFLGQYREANATVSVSTGEFPSGTTLSAVVKQEYLFSSYPESGTKLTIGETLDFTFATGTVSFGSFTNLTYDSANSNEFSSVYTQDLSNGESNSVRFGISTAGGTTYITAITVTFKRKANPGDAQAKEAQFFCGDVTN